MWCMEVCSIVIGFGPYAGMPASITGQHVGPLPYGLFTDLRASSCRKMLLHALQQLIRGPLPIDFSAHSATIGHGHQAAPFFGFIHWYTAPIRFVLTSCARRLCLRLTEQNYARNPQ